MDAKALAKSKRAHTQHHKKHHHLNNQAKGSVVGVKDGGDLKEQSGKQQVGEKSQQVRRRSPVLPSNWDRYEEEFDSDSVDPSKVPSDVVVPKSKGADYRHLMAEAQAQADSTICSDSFPSLEDALPGDLSWGLGPLLSVRGEGMLSWVGGDNFIVDEKAYESHEASLISLNLHALAEQLEKVDLSERLFIEADILPPELCSKLSGNNADQAQTASESVAPTQQSEESVVIHEDDINFAGSSGGGPLLSNETLIPVDQLSFDLSDVGESKKEQPSNFARNNTQLSTAEYNVDHKPSSFEATAAKAELDLLLDSFNDSKLDSSGFSSGKAPFVEQETPTAIPQRFGKGLDSPSIGANFDDDLDNLLDETLNVLKETSLSQPVETRPSVNFQSSSIREASMPSVQSRKGTNSLDLKSRISNLDDDLDVLLEETSNSSQNSLSQPNKIETRPHGIQSSSTSNSKSKAPDDFDSWLDTI